MPQAKPPKEPTEPVPPETALADVQVQTDPEGLEPATLAQEELAPDAQSIEERLIADPAWLRQVVLALLFMEPEPVTPPRLAQGLGIPVEAVEDALLAVKERLEGTGLLCRTGAGAYSLGTHPSVAAALEKYYNRQRRRKLSRAMLETLAIIAIQGPVTRAQVEELRQVNSDGVINRCLELEFIEVVGQRETPGRPMLYGVTAGFLRHFGVDDPSALHELLPVEWGTIPRQTLLQLEAPAAVSAPASAELEED